MVISFLRNITRGFPILILLFLLNFASADTFTGYAQPLFSEFSECSAPAQDLANGAATAQIASDFTYWACREYRATKTKAIYYKIEVVSDGEYVHMIPAPGKNAIDPMDFQYTTANVFQTCRKIRDLTIAVAVPPAASKCAAK